LQGLLQGDEEHVSGWDLVYDNGFLEIDPQQCGYSSFLGAAVPSTDTEEQTEFDDMHGIRSPPEKSRFDDVQAQAAADMSSNIDGVGNYGSIDNEGEDDDYSGDFEKEPDTARASTGRGKSRSASSGGGAGKESASKASSGSTSGSAQKSARKR
jgi:hypothetical protein